MCIFSIFSDHKDCVFDFNTNKNYYGDFVGYHNTSKCIEVCSAIRSFDPKILGAKFHLNQNIPGCWCWRKVYSYYHNSLSTIGCTLRPKVVPRYRKGIVSSIFFFLNFRLSQQKGPVKNFVNLAVFFNALQLLPQKKIRLIKYEKKFLRNIDIKM